MGCVWDSDLVTAAFLTIERHGDAAMQFAADTMLQLAEKGDEIGAEAWRQIAMAVSEFQRPLPANGERVN